jgi:glucose/arabinose dehydrogenase
VRKQFEGRQPSGSADITVPLSITKALVGFCLLGLLALMVAPASAAERALRAEDIEVADGFRIEVAVEGLAAPTMVAFDDQDRMLIAESGYCPDPDRCPDGPGAPKVTRIEENGRRTTLAEGRAFGEEVPVTSVAFHEGQIYVAHGGTISTVEDDGTLRNLITGLPGQGDHQANQIVFKDGFMYFAVGTATNSAVVGPDNAVFGWLTKPNLRQLHDVPCRDITLAGGSFESPNPLEREPGVIASLGGRPTVTTGAFAPFGSVLPAGRTVRGDVKCNGSILRARPDGSGLEMFAWGLRNPYGLEVGPDNELYATMHGFDARGSRPIENAWDCFYRLQQDAWYGWPDFACDRPVTEPRFQPKDKPQPEFLIRNHPTETPPVPIAKFKPHEATNGFAFSPSSVWGPRTTAYIALFGDFTPATGPVDRPQGVKVVRLDTRTGRATDFLRNRIDGRASQHNTGGLEHPSDVTFGPDGDMYIADWGVARVSVDGLRLEPASGVVWRVSRGQQPVTAAGGPTLVYAIVALAVLAVLTVMTGIGSRRSASVVQGVLAGAGAALVLGAFAMFVAAPILRLPWHAPPRVLATMVMGEDAVANILEFEFASFAAGVIVVLVIGIVSGAIYAALTRAGAVRMVLGAVLFALTLWVALQYFLLPALFPLVVDKGFPPLWYGLTFGVFGLALGLLLALLSRGRSSSA